MSASNSASPYEAAVQIDKRAGIVARPQGLTEAAFERGIGQQRACGPWTTGTRRNGWGHWSPPALAVRAVARASA